MFPSTHSPTLSAPFIHNVMIEALICATLLGIAVTAIPARAQTVAAPALPEAVTAVETDGGTAARRIINLNTGG